jgi:hypothetical protein
MGWFDLWLSGCGVEGVGVESARCRSVGGCRYLWVVCGCMGGLDCGCLGVGLMV